MQDSAPDWQAMEMWGGVECTVNRVGDRWFDQSARTGHMLRLDDLDRFADLGLTALRFPVLWDHTQPDRYGELDWRWADCALSRLRERGVRPIIGLLHHGFGPRWVDARDPDFAVQFARYARRVAERYPWIDAYTPVNEPLTTARFSGLYGHWYPHARDDRSFAALLLAQLDATRLALREIRSVNSSAQLVQTEDLGKVTSTPALERQRDFENERRWLTWDIQGGVVTRDHACWDYLREACPDLERVLEPFADGNSAPQLIGVNHYVTSERYLDERVDRYSLDEIGGNGRDVYADVAQVQVPSLARTGIAGLLRESWQRYGRSLAVTECHIGCTREEQMRWLLEVWQAAVRARHDGIDVRAVTTWALLGSYDWNSLVTREAGYYESGAFDVRGPLPRATALAGMVRALAQEGTFAHPALATPGWWRRGDTVPSVNEGAILILQSEPDAARSLIVACDARGLAHTSLEHAELEGESCESIERILDSRHAWAVIATGECSDALVDACARRSVALARHSAYSQDTNDALDLLLDEAIELTTAHALSSADR
ncbi:MAG TPA: family 1 glycosylhydrolase [Gemmatimonadaceae bacterium]|nr:family 1 glycosylhydrolase [Gemmatimonadaceae bacterium]